MRIIITPGEPSGIGPDIVLQIAQMAFAAQLIVVADRELLQQRAQQLKLPLTLIDFNPKQLRAIHKPGRLFIQHVPLQNPCIAGQANPGNADYVLKTLDIATKACLQKQCHALVTGPVNKAIMQQAGIPFTGHTEYLTQVCNKQHSVMLFTADDLRLALLTTHVPLRQVAQTITIEKLKQTIDILHRALQNDFAIKHPRLLVCGLNPHAGEGGYLGREEIDMITPVIQYYRAQGMSILGPLPADTIFTPHYREQSDAILSMYHDQSLPVLKALYFDQAVNVTLGLPIVRTSVDHGTAFNLAGSGRSNPLSLKKAIETAMHITQNRRLDLSM